MEFLNSIAELSFYGSSGEKFLAGFVLAFCFFVVFIPVLLVTQWLDARSRDRIAFYNRHNHTSQAFRKNRRKGVK
jgi:hypothetical protein